MTISKLVCRLFGPHFCISLHLLKKKHGSKSPAVRCVWNYELKQRESADQTEGMMEEYDYKDTSKTLHLNFRGKIRENNMDNVDDDKLCSLHLYMVLLS